MKKQCENYNKDFCRKAYPSCQNRTICIISSITETRVFIFKSIIHWICKKSYFSLFGYLLLIDKELTSRIFSQKLISSSGKASHLSFNAGHLDSKTNLGIEPSSVVYWKGRCCQTSSAKWGSIGAITLAMESRCAARTVWQLLLVKLVEPLGNKCIYKNRIPKNNSSGGMKLML